MSLCELVAAPFGVVTLSITLSPLALFVVVSLFTTQSHDLGCLGLGSHDLDCGYSGVTSNGL